MTPSARWQSSIPRPSRLIRWADRSAAGFEQAMIARTPDEPGNGQHCTHARCFPENHTTPCVPVTGGEAVVLLHAGRHLLAAPQLAVRVRIDHCLGEAKESACGFADSHEQRALPHPVIDERIFALSGLPSMIKRSFSADRARASMPACQLHSCDYRSDGCVHRKRLTADLLCCADRVDLRLPGAARQGVPQHDRAVQHDLGPVRGHPHHPAGPSSPQVMGHRLQQVSCRTPPLCCPALSEASAAETPPAERRSKARTSPRVGTCRYLSVSCS